jgi:hypothetical protein
VASVNEVGEKAGIIGAVLNDNTFVEAIEIVGQTANG